MSMTSWTKKDHEQLRETGKACENPSLPQQAQQGDILKESLQEIDRLQFREMMATMAKERAEEQV